MSWFFPVSKAAGFLLVPTHLLLSLAVATAVALFLGRVRLAQALAAATAALFLLIGVAPVGPFLAQSLEGRFARPALPARIDGIVTLGGGLSAEILRRRGAPGTSASIDRLVSAYELARRHPEARVVFSGGWGRDNDAIAARDDFLRLGLAPARLTLEDRSRNTLENIAFTKALVRPQPGQRWVLATSAIQLPRAMMTARRLGWEMIPWPTDYQTAPGPALTRRWFAVGSNLKLTDAAVHEWIGMAAYAISARQARHSPR